MGVTPSLTSDRKDFLDGIDWPLSPNHISLFWSNSDNLALEYLGNVPTGGSQVIPLLNLYVNSFEEPLFACIGVDFQTPFGWLSGLE